MDNGHEDSITRRKQPKATNPVLTKITISTVDVSAQASLRDRWCITDVMLDLVGSTEEQTECRCGLDSRVQRATEPHGFGQNGTHPPTHHAGVPGVGN